MFRHVVMVRLSEDMTDGQKEALRAGLGRLPERIPGIRSYRFGDDAGLNEGNFDFVVTADFDDVDGYLAYRDHPDHQKLVAELLGPFVTKRAAVQFEWSAALPTDLPG
ncbi:MAG TPA: Dabb family protein [Acidimicrobiia bacterium]|nr:Dabb family protein [Acidimicrobiia bacterium]